MRECRSCLEKKPLNEFRFLKGRWYTHKCRGCLYIESITGPDRAEVKSPRRKAYYKANSEREKAGVKKWVSENRQAKTSHNRKRALRLLELAPIKQKDWERVLREQGSNCLKCGSSSVTVDHIVPISKGGTNEYDNLQPLCSSCNAKKRVQTIDYRRQLSLNEKSAI